MVAQTPQGFQQNLDTREERLLPNIEKMAPNVEATLPQGVARSEFMEAVENRLQRMFNEDLPPGANDPEILIEAARYLCLSDNAKRFRPQLSFLFGQAVGTPGWEMVDIGVAAELIHAASLLHDDIVDESSLRRGSPTVNYKWGNKVAVLTGDLVLSLAFFLLKSYPHQIICEATDVVTAMSRAAMVEVEVRGSLEYQIQRWRMVALGKTGMLFAWPGRSAGHIAQNEDAVERFTKCGEHLGVAFQMADDYRDIAGSDPGKERFADIKNRNPSFPILRAVESCESLRKKLEKCWGQSEITTAEATQLGHDVLETKAMDISREALQKEVAAAIDALGPYGSRPGGTDIVRWAEFLLSTL